MGPGGHSAVALHTQIHPAGNRTTGEGAMTTDLHEFVGFADAVFDQLRNSWA